MSLFDRILTEKIKRDQRKSKGYGFDQYIGWNGAKTQTKHGEVSTWVDRGGSEPVYKTTFMRHKDIAAMRKGRKVYQHARELGNVQGEREAKLAHLAHVERVRSGSDNSREQVEQMSLYSRIFEADVQQRRLGRRKK